ncbi:MAG: HesA/MoeB/ThiF family protein [Muribaculaceae bacterium]
MSTDTSDNRYSRQTMLPEIGIEGQRRLASATVAVIGLGGLGSAAATYLTGAGVGHLILVDGDTVSLSNLQRQVLYTEATVGEPKSATAAARLAAQSSATRFDIIAENLTEANADSIVAGCDVVVDCTDNYAARYLIDDVCARHGCPWVYGSIGATDGQLAVFNYRRGVRYADLYPDRAALCALPRVTAGVIGVVPGVIGTLEASEATKIIAGFGDVLDGRLFTIDFKSMQTLIIDI